MFQEIKVKDNTFIIPEWGMEKQFENHHVVMPLIKDPVVNALAYASDSDGEADESLFFAAIVDGIFEALSQVNMLKVVNVLLEGVWFSTPKTKKSKASLKNLQESGLDISDVLIVCVNVIKVNYGAYLKKDLPDSLQNLIPRATNDNEGNPS